MNISKLLCTEAAGKRQWVFVAVFISLASAHAQSSFEITPLVAGRFGGSIKLQQAGQANLRANPADSVGFGVAGGYRFDADDCDQCSIIGFRWMRQTTHLGFNDNSPNAASFRPAVTLNHFLGDFTHEFPIKEPNEIVKPFLMVSVGAIRLSTPVESRTRFEFGIGGGVNVFPKPRWGVRFQVEYLPIVMHAEVQKVVCSGGCIVTLNGGVMNQVVMSLGPIFRF